MTWQSSVLITGGTGFFGQAFVEHLLNNSPLDRIIILSRGEHKQAEMRERFRNDDRLRFLIGDVRDPNRLRRAFDGVDTVVHAAALKRIEVGAYNPTEMVATNVTGTMNVIDAAFEARVRRVLFLSSDKAWQPISAYGQSKALAETLILSANNMSNRTDRRRPFGPQFSATRYGNVMGSAGSVVPRWRKILERSSTVPITSPDCTRFWMRAEEAVKLVLDTLQEMPTDRPAIPILPAFRLGDLAEAMGAKTEIKGLPEFEKVHEGMEDGNTSDKARRMSVEEIRSELKRIL